MSFVDKIKPGKNPPEELYAIIEIPMGSSIKYELDKDTGLLVVDRFLFTAMQYPFNYGFIPQTLEPDGDPLDALIISSQPVSPGTILPCKPIGLLDTEDEEGRDTKLIATPIDKIDPTFAEIKDIKDLPEATRNKIEHFFKHYKELEPGKWVKVIGWHGVDKALERVREAIERYKREKRS